MQGRDVENIEEGKRDGFAKGVDGGDGDFFEAEEGAVDAGDNAEIVTESEVDEVEGDRKVVPAGTTIDDP